MSRFVGHTSYFQDDFDDKEVASIVESAIEKALELSKEHGNLHFRVFPEGQTGYVVFATEPFKDREAERWYERITDYDDEDYDGEEEEDWDDEEEEEDRFDASKKCIYLLDPPPLIKEAFSAAEGCNIMLNGRTQSASSGDIVVTRASAYRDAAAIEQLLMKNVSVVLIVSEDYLEKAALFSHLELIRISNIPSKEELNEALRRLNLPERP